MAHAIRRWLWSCAFHFDRVAAILGPWARRVGRCMWCGVKLTADERKYYGTVCERCEGENMERWGDT